MSTLTIRNLDEDLKRRLRVRAAENGQSMEAEVRDIIRRSLVDEPTIGLGTWLHQHFLEIGGPELALPARDESPRAPDLR